MDLKPWIHAYRQMARIREFEEKVNELYLSGIMPGLAHLYSGQEAVAWGLPCPEGTDDYITSPLHVLAD